MSGSEKETTQGNAAEEMSGNAQGEGQTAGTGAGATDAAEELPGEGDQGSVYNPDFPPSS